MATGTVHDQLRRLGTASVMNAGNGPGDVVTNANLQQALTEQAGDISDMVAQQVGAAIAAIPVPAAPIDFAPAIKAEADARDLADKAEAKRAQDAEALAVRFANITTYTASGAINPADDLALVKGSVGTLAMTLAAGTVDRHLLTVKRMGAAVVTVAGMIDGTTVLTAALNGLLTKEAMRFLWLKDQSMWIQL